MTIEILGFPPARNGNAVKAIRKQLQANGATNCKVKPGTNPVFNSEGNPIPLIRIYSEKEEDFKFVAKHLKSEDIPGATGRILVQCVLLHESFMI